MRRGGGDIGGGDTGGGDTGGRVGVYEGASTMKGE